MILIFKFDSLKIFLEEFIILNRILHLRVNVKINCNLSNLYIKYSFVKYHNLKYSHRPNHMKFLTIMFAVSIMTSLTEQINSLNKNKKKWSPEQ